jgi:hypothetical protein
MTPVSAQSPFDVTIMELIYLDSLEKFILRCWKKRKLKSSNKTMQSLLAAFFELLQMKRLEDIGWQERQSMP